MWVCGCGCGWVLKRLRRGLAVQRGARARGRGADKRLLLVDRETRWMEILFQEEEEQLGVGFGVEVWVRKKLSSNGANNWEEKPSGCQDFFRSERRRENDH